MTNSHTHHSGRSTKIDVLRGLAVVGMIIAHALFFFHDKSNSSLTIIEKILNTTVFTLFVFVFGQSLSKWLDIHSQDHNKKIFWSSLNRAGTIYLVFIATSLASMLTSPNGLNNLISVLTLNSAPSFTEYMLLFIVLSLMIPLLRPLLRYTRKSLLLTFVVGAFFYLLGITLYEFAVPDFLRGIKGIFAGGEGLLRFPVLLYLPVVLWGVWWQYDSDHNEQDKEHTINHLWVLLVSVGITVVGALSIRFFNVPILNPDIRWPPSVAFLSLGMSIAAIALFLMPSLSWVGNGARRVVSYFGRDALDIWVSHLLLLFIYRKFISFQSGDSGVVVVMLLLLTLATVLLSSLHVTNKIQFPFRVTFAGTTRFRVRYAFYTVIALIITLITIVKPTNPYGNFLNAPALTVQQKIPEDTQISISTSSNWYVRHNPVPQSLELVLVAVSNQKNLPINPELVKIRMNNKITDFSGNTASDGTLHFSKPVADIPAGTYELTAAIDNGDATITTNPVTVNVSEPLLVAWTLDWEGWDVTDTTLQKISELTSQNPTLKFTHFVNPRTFLPGVVAPQRSQQLATFLNDRYLKGEEIAMHLHMHYDLVSEAGVATRSAQHWGMRSSEGYDIPTTAYTPVEFVQIVRYAQSLAKTSGLPPMTGFRAGGWFLNTRLLNELHPLGFTYDSSGRDRASTGAFRNIPWDLPVGAQPYFPSAADQNIKSNESIGILEIPNNGVSTYDQSVDMLTARLNEVYTGGVLFAPKVLVYVSHPQFYTQEFWKIPEVLKEINAVSQVTNRGPAIFVTTAAISDLWHTLYK